MKVKLYTIGCPQCKVLEGLLGQAHITYETIEDIELMKEKGIHHLPCLEVDDKMMGFAESYRFVKDILSTSGE